MRTYIETHPWINFHLDLKQASYQLWLLLGEAQALCKSIAGIPLLPQVAQELLRVYLAKGVVATTAIEGNTLTEEEVLKRMDGQLKLNIQVSQKVGLEIGLLMLYFILLLKELFLVSQ